MIYLGSKRRLAKEIHPVMFAERKPGQTWVEPFAGGLGSADQVPGPVVAGDYHRELVLMWRKIQQGWDPETRAEYDLAHQAWKANDYSLIPAHEVGWIGFAGSYRGKFFGGYASGGHAEKQSNSIRRQIPNIGHIDLHWAGYWELPIPPESLIYCDPPYLSTTDYKGANSFDHTIFWEWCGQMADDGHTVFVSESTGPKWLHHNVEVVWEKVVKSTLNYRDQKDIGGRVERLFRVYPT